MAAYVLRGVKIGASAISGIVDQSVAPGLQSLIQGGSGSVSPTFGGVGAYEPRLRFTTVAVDEVLTALTLNGGSIAGAELWFQAFAPSAARASDAFIKVTAKAGIGLIRRISGAHGSAATVEVEMILVGDDSNAPMAVASASSCTLSQAVAKVYTLGPVSINGTAYLPQSLEIDPGARENTIRDSGILWPTEVHVLEYRPTVTIQTLSADLATGLLAPGPALTVTALVAYLRSLSEGGAGLVASATASHIKFSGTQGVASVADLGGGHPEEARLGVRVDLVHDGTNAILAVDTASAIA